MKFPLIIEELPADHGYFNVLDADKQNLFSVGDELQDITKELIKRVNAYDDFKAFIRKLIVSDSSMNTQLYLDAVHLLNKYHDNEKRTNS